MSDLHIPSENAQQTSEAPLVAFVKRCCPPENAPVWNAHPRVFVAVEPGKTANCPYCGKLVQG